MGICMVLMPTVLRDRSMEVGSSRNLTLSAAAAADMVVLCILAMTSRRYLVHMIWLRVIAQTALEICAFTSSLAVVRIVPVSLYPNRLAVRPHMMFAAMIPQQMIRFTHGGGHMISCL